MRLAASLALESGIRMENCKMRPLVLFKGRTARFGAATDKAIKKKLKNEKIPVLAWPKI